MQSNQISYEIKEIMNFFSVWKRFPYYFTYNLYEKELYLKLYNIVEKFKLNEIKDDEKGTIKFFSENQTKYVDQEIEHNINIIKNMIENGVDFKDYETKYPKFIVDFINFYKSNKYYMTINNCKKFENIPTWKWDDDVFEKNIQKLHHFCKYKERLPTINTTDLDEYKLALFVNSSYYGYVYELLSSDEVRKLSLIHLFSFDDYKKIENLSFTNRYINEIVYNEFYYYFYLVYNFYIEKQRLPKLEDGEEYENCLKIKKLFYDMKLSFLEIKVTEEMKGWKWGYDFYVEKHDPSKNGIPMFTDDKYIDSMLKNTNRNFIRRNYNYKDKVYNLKTDSVSRRKSEYMRLSKKKALLRLKILRNIENGLISE